MNSHEWPDTPFVPATSDSDSARTGSEGEEGGGDSHALIKGASLPCREPAPFDGKGTWDAYHTQFEIVGSN